tara:strand:+ start:3505 stop:3963 length:459 start_codon:yes stop_codon:yes gene_type:complete
MKIKFLAFLFTALFVTSCATPKAIDIVQIGDNEMSCNELKLAYESANYHEDFAHQNKGVTDENILSGLFFFPAYFVTYGTSIHAEFNASQRKDHLLRLYLKKECGKGRDAQYQAKISQKLKELEDLKRLYVKGRIDQEEYLLSRKQILIEFD